MRPHQSVCAVGACWAPPSRCAPPQKQTLSSTRSASPPAAVRAPVHARVCSNGCIQYIGLWPVAARIVDWCTAPAFLGRCCSKRPSPPLASGAISSSALQIQLDREQTQRGEIAEAAPPPGRTRAFNPDTPLRVAWDWFGASPSPLPNSNMFYVRFCSTLCSDEPGAGQRHHGALHRRLLQDRPLRRHVRLVCCLHGCTSCIPCTYTVCRFVFDGVVDVIFAIDIYMNFTTG